jgi:fumarate reductase flavoprotein subunit
MTYDNNVTMQELETEIVIIGAGGAGLAAALTTGEKGTRVIVLEKQHSPGGNSVMAEGLFAAESPVQKKKGINASRDELFNTAMNYSHWIINPRIMRAFVDKSGDTIKWLEDMGLTFYLDPLYPDQAPLVFHCLKRGGAEVIDTLIKSCQVCGVIILLETATKKILTDASGDVTGVLAIRNNQDLKIKAKSVIIATGGYGGNQELLKKYCASYKEDTYLRGIPNTGDGLVMAIEAGAATEGLGILQLGGPSYRGSALIASLAREPFTVWVNKNGERYTNEAITFYGPETANTLDHQPGKISYAILDEQIRQMIVDNGKFVKRSRIKSFTADELESTLRKEAAGGMLWITGSWVEIAGYIGVKPEVLETTIAEYNASCELGQDKVFTKDSRYLKALRSPPYYAIRCGQSFLGTIGGIKINHRMEVLDKQDNPIPGLFAAGVDTGGWESDTYCSLLSGSTFGFAINSGRIAGENAVNYIKRIN